MCEHQILVHLLPQLGIQFRHPCLHTHQQNGKWVCLFLLKLLYHLNFGGMLLFPLFFLLPGFLLLFQVISLLSKSCLTGFLITIFLKVFRCSCFSCLRPYSAHKFQYIGLLNVFFLVIVLIIKGIAACVLLVEFTLLRLISLMRENFLTLNCFLFLTRLLLLIVFKLSFFPSFLLSDFVDDASFLSSPTPEPSSPNHHTSDEIHSAPLQSLTQSTILPSAPPPSHSSPTLTQNISLHHSSPVVNNHPMITHAC